MEKVCPVGFFCFDRKTVLLIIVCFIFIVFYQIHMHSKFLEVQKDDLQNKKTELLQMNKLLENKDEKISNLREEKNDYQRNLDEQMFVLNKDHERVVNPLLPPERSYPYRLNRFGVPVNIPTRGYSSHYQQVGSLTENGENGKILPLYGKPYYPGSRQWYYYTGTDAFSPVKLPVVNKNKSCQSEHGCDEIFDGDNITVTGYNGKTFTVNLYEIDKPRYIPYIV